MKASRKKPWKTVRTKQGLKVKYDFQDLTWGINRTRATFNTVEEAQAYHEALLKNAMTIAKGEQPERTFGEAMIEYLEQIESEGKLSLLSDKSDLMTLRWPFNYQGKWFRLEELVLNDQEMGIVWGIKKYLLDLSLVVRRSYINKKIYHLRRENQQLIWFEQPSPADDSRPKNRTKVIEPSILKKLEACKGRGAFSKDTLRRRVSVAKTILHTAWHDWRWFNQDLAALIKLDKPGKGRIAFLTADQFETLVTETDKWFSFLIRGGKAIGWRRSNLIGLTWDRVVFPQYLKDEQGNSIKIPGYLRIEAFEKDSGEFDPADLTQRRTRTKNKDALETIMSQEIEILLYQLQQDRVKGSNVVFHDGDGDYWKDFRKRWVTAKKKAGIPEDFRWHDLRHTWATERINEGVPDHIIMEEQGWKDRDMVKRYAHIQREARYAALKKASSGT